MPEVIVQVAPDDPSLADATRHAPFTTAKNLGHTLEPIHPNSPDPALSRWFRAEVDEDKVSQLVTALQNEPRVTAAYVKPRAEPP